jgi:predicted transposase YbfD/YdcC
MLKHFLLLPKISQKGIQQLIAELGLSDCLFTADALHCQKKRWKQP